MKLKFTSVLLFIVICNIFISLSALTIYDIQYTEEPSGDSPYEGEEVTTSGIVTGSGYDGNKYFISMPEGGAWKGIYVYDYSNSPNLGDEIEITSVVDEYYNMTELTNISGFSVLSSGNPIPDPVNISTNELATEEQYEGVLVKISNVVVTETPNNYNEWYVSDGSGECQIDDGFYEYPNPEIGEEFYSITGLIDYSFYNFALNPRDENDFILMGVPIIEDVYTIPSYPSINEEITMVAEVFDYDRFISEVKIYYRYAGEVDFIIEDMLDIGDNKYEYALSALTAEDEKYEVKIFAKDDDNNQTFSELFLIEILQLSPIISNLQILNSPEPNDTLQISVNIEDTDGQIVEAQLLYKLDYNDKIYYADLEQDLADSTLFFGLITGKSAGITVNIGAYAIDDSSLVTIEYNLASYTFPVKTHKAILKVPPKPFDPYAGEKIIIDFYSKEDDKAILRIYNAEGKLMFTPQNIIIANQNGLNQYEWDGRDKYQNLLPIGLYICYLEVINADTGSKKTAKAPIVIGAPLK